MDQIVWKTAPNLATAAYKANLSKSSKNSIESYTYLFDKHRELLNMDDKDNAKLTYDALDPEIQKALESLFGKSDYNNQPSNWSLASAAFNFIKSPFVGAFNVAKTYGDVINMPGRTAQLAAQGPDLSNKIWQDGWDGANMFDQKQIETLDATYGATVGTVARGLAQGKTPGEIIANQGLDSEELRSIVDLVFNQPDTFRPILDQYKRAQLSPGRTTARNVLGNRQTDNPFYKLAFNTLSGVLDLQYQIMIDPLTYVTFGLGPIARLGLTRASKLANLAKLGADGIDIAFEKFPEVVQAWDNLGPKVQRYAEAKGNPVAQKSIKDEILKITQGTQFDTDEALSLLAANKVFDAKSAREYFSKMDDFALFFGGRTHSTQRFVGNHVLHASKTRAIKKEITEKVSNFWQAATKSALTPSEQKLFTEDFLQTTLLMGEETALGSTKNLETFANAPSVRIARESLKGVNGLLNKLRIHPGNRTINIVNNVVEETETGAKALTSGVDNTLDVVESTAGLVMSKPLAQLYTQMFRNLETPGDRVLALRGLYSFIMHRMGVSAMPGGEEFMKRILNEQFGNAPGFLSQVESFIGKEFVDAGVVSAKQRVLSGGPEALDENLPVRQITSGAIHAYNETPYIGQLPWQEIAQFTSDALFKVHGGSKYEMLKRVGAITNSKTIQGLNDNWTFFTLAPKLGIKSAIDEQMFFMLYAPKEALYNYLSGVGRFGATAAGVMLGGPVKSIAWLRNKLRNYSGAITDEVRAQIVARDLSQVEKIGFLADESIRAVDEKTKIKIVTAQQREDMHDLLVNNPHALESVTSTVAVNSGLGGRFEMPRIEIAPLDTLSKQVEELGGTISSIFKPVAENADRRQRAISQWWETKKRFGMNDFRLGNPKSQGFKVYWRPAETFFKHNGLQTPKDIQDAVDSSMLNIGFWKDSTDNWIISNPKTVGAFINGSADSVVKRKQGFTDAEIAQERVVNVLADLKNEFNGGYEKAFNQRLWDLINSKIAPNAPTPVTLDKAWKELDFEEYFAASQDNLITGQFKTNIDFAGSDGISSFGKVKEWFYERFDQQVTAWHRAPAHTAMYLAKREVYRQAEQDFAKEILKSVGPNPSDSAMFWAKEVAKKRYTEIANQEATMELLNFVDNPAIRSQLAWSVRNVGRFYRATEDFMRRFYRLRKHTLPVIYRMRLASLGLDGSGFIHEDASGGRYVIMPMDNLIFQAVSPVMNVLGGGEAGYKQPLFNNFSLNLNFANPSLSPDAAMPTLSGPVAGGSVWLFKTIVGNLPGSYGDIVADRVDNIMLGEIGDNLTLRRAMVPVWLDRGWRVLSSDDKEKQEVTAVHQAIAYNQANGIGLPVNATAEEKYEYIKKIRITGHNVVALRNILGMTPIPFGVSTKESRDVPDYLREVGISAIRQEFFDLYENLAKAPNPRRDDLYEEALVAFVGQNPNRLVYTVSRNDKVQEIAFQKTDAVKDWTIRNQDFIKKYGDVAFLAAPDVGDFSPAAYAWFEASEMIKSRDLESFLNEVQVAVDRQRYFDAEDKAFDAIANEPDYRKHQYIKSATEQYRKALRISNPFLDRALQQGDFGISKQETMLRDLKSMLNDPTAPIDEMTRNKLIASTEIVDDSMNYFNYKNSINDPNAVRDKKIYRNNALTDLRKLTIGDGSLSQASKVIFEPMLKFKSRDTL